MKKWINQIHLGDTLDVLKQMPGDFVDLIITSPPYYGLRDYQIKGQIGLEDSFEDYLDKMLAIIKELKRVLKKSGQFWLNMGDCYGGIKVGKTDEKVSEYVKNSQKGIRKNLPKQEKCMLMMPERLSIAMCDQQGWILRNKIKWAKQVLLKKKNRTVGSVMPTSAKDRFNESGEELYFFVKSKRYYSDLDAVRLPPQSELNFERPRMGQGGQTIYEQKRAGTKKYQGKFEGQKDAEKFNSPRARTQRKSLEARNTGIEPNKVKYDISKRQKELNRKGGLPTNQRVQGFYDTFGGDTNLAGKNLPTIWLVGSEPHNFSNELGVDSEHFAIFPQALLEIPIKFGCPKNGIVLDPFMGSGTTALVARSLSRRWIGIELSPAYIAIAKKRMAQKVLF